MGNLCGKETKTNDPFDRPGRVLGSAPPRQDHSSVPATAGTAATHAKVQGPGRTLGGGPPADGGSDDPRAAAAKAAEARAKKAQSTGGKVAAQKRQNALEQASYENRRARDADAAAEARNWN